MTLNEGLGARAGAGESIGRGGWAGELETTVAVITEPKRASKVRTATDAFGRSARGASAGGAERVTFPQLLH